MGLLAVSLYESYAPSPRIVTRLCQDNGDGRLRGGDRSGAWAGGQAVHRAEPERPDAPSSPWSRRTTTNSSSTVSSTQFQSGAGRGSSRSSASTSSQQRMSVSSPTDLTPGARAVDGFVRHREGRSGPPTRHFGDTRKAWKSSSSRASRAEGNQAIVLATMVIAPRAP